MRIFHSSRVCPIPPCPVALRVRCAECCSLMRESINLCGLRLDKQTPLYPMKCTVSLDKLQILVHLSFGINSNASQNTQGCTSRPPLCNELSCFLKIQHFRVQHSSTTQATQKILGLCIHYLLKISQRTFASMSNSVPEAGANYAFPSKGHSQKSITSSADLRG